MFEYKGYCGSIEPDDGQFIGRVIGLKDVVTFAGASFAEVEAAFRDSVDDYLAFCAERGEAPDRPYSGKIPLRVDPSLHRQAAIRAAGEGLSLNQWIANRISA
ncbi:MAG: type II toxin-antitoxin system HicB family antitoxin [Sphingomonadales bacterium]|jgi:predicted HicB family RNase H-like nuclease